jgi:phosphoribosylformylglycinamidine (FGAM) synthase PurS component
MSKPSIPAVSVEDPRAAALFRPIKENIEILTGVRTGKVKKLPVDADLSAAISKLNEVIDRLNA